MFLININIEVINIFLTLCQIIIQLSIQPVYRPLLPPLTIYSIYRSIQLNKSSANNAFDLQQSEIIMQILSISHLIILQQRKINWLWNCKQSGARSTDKVYPFVVGHSVKAGKLERGGALHIYMYGKRIILWTSFATRPRFGLTSSLVSACSTLKLDLTWILNCQ